MSSTLAPSNAGPAPATLAIVVNFNGGQWLRRCVQALRQSCRPVSIRVVDNHSADDSLASIGQWLEPGGPVQLIRNTENRGFSVACNQGAEDASSSYLLFVNPDCQVEEDTVGAMEDALEQHPEAGIAGVCVVGPDGLEQRGSRRRAPTLLGASGSALGLEGTRGINPRGPAPSEPTAVEAVSGAVMLVREACFREIGGFDEGYFLHCEDLDLFARARLAGWKILYLPRIRAVHQGGASHRGLRLRTERHKHAGMVRYYRRHLAADVPPWLRWFWPLAIWARYLLLVPALVWRQRRESR